MANKNNIVLKPTTDINNGDVIVSVKDLIVRFSVRGKILTAIRKVSLDIYKGEILAIVGESGSGKSVFTKCFTGMLEENGSVDENSQILYSGVNLAHFKSNEEWLNIRDSWI